MTTTESITREKENKATALVNRFMPLRRLGWAFLLAWVFCVFYTAVVEGYTGSIGTSSPGMGFGLLVFFGGLPVTASVVMLAIIVFAEKSLGSPVEHRSVFWLAPLLTALSTPMLFWAFDDLAMTAALFAVGSVLTGIGSGLMWVMWGEYYARISQEDVEFLTPVSAIIAALLVLVLSAMSGWVALLVVTSFPVFSGLCFFLSWKDVEQGATMPDIHAFEQKALHVAHDKAKNSPFQVLRDRGRVGLGIFAASMFGSLEGSFWEGADKGSFAFQAVILASILFMGIIAFASTLGPRRISISFLYRWFCPVLVLGFAALILFGLDGGYFAYATSIAARFAFCLITQMYFAHYASRGKATAVQSFGLGWIFVHLGDMFGVFCSKHVAISLIEGVFTVTQVAAVSIAALVVITMFVLNDEKSFAFGQGDRKPSPTGGQVPDETEEAVAEEGGNLDERIRQLAEHYELTPRETEVFHLLARGRSIPYIRDSLVISKETAATHTKHIYAKLDVHSRQELIDLVH